MKQTLIAIDEKNILLRSVSGSGAEQVTTIVQQWGNFEMLLNSHQSMIKEQVHISKQLFDCI